MRSKIRKIANYPTFYEIISLLAIFESIYIKLNNISEKKTFIFLKPINPKNKIYIQLFYRRSQTIVFSNATFFYFHFISVSKNLANIRVDFTHDFLFLIFVVLFWYYVIYCKKKKVSRGQQGEEGKDTRRVFNPNTKHLWVQGGQKIYKIVINGSMLGPLFFVCRGFLVIFFVQKKISFVTVYSQSLFHKKILLAELKFEKCCETKKIHKGSYYWAQIKF